MQVPRELECCVCEDKTSEDNPHFLQPGKDSTFVCVDCCPQIVSWFEDAVKYEHKYPVKSGKHTVPVEAFADLLGQEFVQAYYKKEDEYKTPDGERVYCPYTVNNEKCNEYLGSRPPATHIVYCAQGENGHFICTRCEKVVDSLITPHVCEAPGAGNDEAIARNFEGLRDGIHYQSCPSCARRFQLSEACNHMFCQRCHVHFCYVCGEKLTKEQGMVHWLKGKPCPRWNGPHNPDKEPIFDAPHWTAVQVQLGVLHVNNPNPEQVVVGRGENEAMRWILTQDFWLVHDNLIRITPEVPIRPVEELEAFAAAETIDQTGEAGRLLFSLRSLISTLLRTYTHPTEDPEARVSELGSHWMRLNGYLNHELPGGDLLHPRISYILPHKIRHALTVAGHFMGFMPALEYYA